ncbi:tetratricopeptide repeat protein [Pseudoduganella sp.]|uniref:tetratricopeptide repeat protein n=1 Tax=Pseudoduganella sp. TaxID=1880898 RepID=UPI0035B0EDC7
MKLAKEDILQISSATLAITLLLYCYHMDTPSNDLPRNQDLPLFRPHRSDFPCTAEAKSHPPLDAQAEAWFREARALEDPSIFYEDRDLKKIVELTRMAADRRHWKAMLNLATYYLEGWDPDRGTEDALKLVEEAMRMGVPAAFDRMGTYFMNGTGVDQDITRAYAFWQKAADMGNPDAMSYLAKRLNVGEDRRGYWSNIPVAVQMMECALAQGNAKMAHTLHYLYAEPRAADGTIIGDRSGETKSRALKVLHLGVKLGCADCARALWLEFSDPLSLIDTIAPYIDKARAERYEMLGDALDYNPYRRFPNLDKVLPLPPAILPPWDGKRESLLAAAMGVVTTPPLPSAPAPANAGRYYLDPAYRLRKTGESTTARVVPFAGYWRPAIESSAKDQARHPALARPGLYAKGEVFETIQSSKPIGDPVWEYYRTIPAEPEAVAPQAVPVLVRKVAQVTPAVQCKSDKPCTVGGIWQPWVADGHPLQSIVNQPWRQTWLQAGQPFPQPERDWLLKLPEEDVTWHLMEKAD